MEKKLTLEELEKYSAAHKEYYKARDVLSDVLIQEERLKTFKQSSLINHDVAQNAIAEMQNELHAKYGEVKINLATGDLS
jgi:pterin-4a-carbinolamine dehydratase